MAGFFLNNGCICSHTTAHNLTWDRGTGAVDIFTPPYRILDICLAFPWKTPWSLERNGFFEKRDSGENDIEKYPGKPISLLKRKREIKICTSVYLRENMIDRVKNTIAEFKKSKTVTWIVLFIGALVTTGAILSSEILMGFLGFVIIILAII
jgi:hypothetical protein